MRVNEGIKIITDGQITDELSIKTKELKSLVAHLHSYVEGYNDFTIDVQTIGAMFVEDNNYIFVNDKGKEFRLDESAIYVALKLLWIKWLRTP